MYVTRFKYDPTILKSILFPVNVGRRNGRGRKRRKVEVEIEVGTGEDGDDEEEEGPAGKKAGLRGWVFAFLFHLRAFLTPLLSFGSEIPRQSPNPAHPCQAPLSTQTRHYPLVGTGMEAFLE